MGKFQAGNKSRVQGNTKSSSGNLEVISQESFVERREGMNACRKCQKERFRSHYNYSGRSGKTGQRRQYSKSKQPFVNDTPPAAGMLRQSSLDGDSDVSSRSTDEDQYPSSSSSSDNSWNTLRRIRHTNKQSNLDYLFTSIYGDVASIPEFVPQAIRNHSYQVGQHASYNSVYQNFPDMFTHSSSSYRSSLNSDPYHFSKAASRKDLTGLLDVILNAHKKKLLDIESNLSRDFDDAKLGSVLNNVSVPSQNDPQSKKKNVADCENIDLICNDLRNSDAKLAESSDDSDASDKASVMSGSDIVSDDAIDSTIVDDNNEHEFTKEELEQLVQFTTGVPLYLASSCVDDSSSYTYQYFPYEVVYPSPYLESKQQQGLYLDNLKHNQPAADSRLRASTSSESDLQSDIEDATSSSSSHSSSSSSSSLSSISSSSKSNAANVDKLVTENTSSSFNLKTASKKSKQLVPRKRVIVSLKCADYYWTESVEYNIFHDSVYLDITNMDVSLSVTYHTESPFWPYTVYSPITAAVTTGIILPIRFNNQIIHPDHVSTVDLNKYEMPTPSLRPWITFSDPQHKVPAALFSVMCYNVLSDRLCTKSFYTYCPTWALNWDYRKMGIMSDIIKGDSDIITLQEVETQAYLRLFLPELAKRGYDGIFLPKSRYRTMNSDMEKASVDGCAIFYRKQKFEKICDYHVEFSQLATKEGHSNIDTAMINRVSTKDNIALVALLRTKPGAYDQSPTAAPKGLSQLLMVATAHIYWNPESPDVKLVQTMMLMEELQKIVMEATLKFRPSSPPFSDGPDMYNRIPLILCGDFNSLPDSGVYEYLSNGKLNTNHKDFVGQNYPFFMKDRNSNGNLTHNFQLKSAYKDVIPFTNYTFDFKGIIDYIFYSKQNIHLHGVLGLQDEEWFRVNKIVGCPHPFIPSDHFPLKAEFSLPISFQQES